MSQQLIVNAVAIKKTYGYNNQSVEALKGVDLSVAKGEFLALAGPSGSGKTTLLNLIGCLDTPSGGTISLDGKNLSGLSRSMLSEIRLKKIGFIFQEYNLIPVLTALENVEYVMLLQGMVKEMRRRRARLILEEVGLSGLENRMPSRMSGGQQQRVAIARAMATEPSIILADEPTANLDSKTGQALLEVMYDLNQRKTITFLFSTHDSMVMNMAKRVVFMKDGRVDHDEQKT